MKKNSDSSSGNQFPSWPFFSEKEIHAVEKVLRSGKVNYWTGQQGRLFEKAFAQYTGTNFAVALANGTVALELALHALGIGPGDEVITTSRTFIASASAIVMCGAIPVFADVDAESQNVTHQTIADVITPRTKAIIVVHLAGWPCDMDPIMQLARDHDLKVIEDCAQAHGASYKGQMVGSIGDVGAFSFCQDKIMTTGGEGGMLTTNNPEIWEKAWAFKDHGKNFSTVYHRKHPPGFRWLHESFGTNWRMTEMQAAIGIEALKNLDLWVAHRRSNAEKLTQCFSQINGLRVTVPPSDVFKHSYYKYYVFVRPQQLPGRLSRDMIMGKLNAQGIPCFSGSCSEIYREKAFLNADLVPGNRLPVARELGGTSLMFLVHPTLRDEDILRVCHAVEKLFKTAQE